MADSSIPDGWYKDPTGRYDFRYWRASSWTEHVSTAGVVGSDALVKPAEPTPAKSNQAAQQTSDNSELAADSVSSSTGGVSSEAVAPPLTRRAIREALQAEEVKRKELETAESVDPTSAEVEPAAERPVELSESTDESEGAGDEEPAADDALTNHESIESHHSDTRDNEESPPSLQQLGSKSFDEAAASEDKASEAEAIGSVESEKVAEESGASSITVPSFESMNPTPALYTPKQVNFFNGSRIAKELIERNGELETFISHYELRSFQELAKEFEKEQGRVDALRVEAEEIKRESAELQTTVVDLRGVSELQEFGYYDFEHPAESSFQLAEELASLRERCKKALREKTASSARPGFIFNDSEAQGRKFVANMSKLLLNAYNAEAENCVKSVKAGNLESAKKRLSNARIKIEKMGAMIEIHISDSYHSDRMKELELANRHLLALQYERELEREHREKLREEKRVEAEIARAKEKLLKERTHYENALKALQIRGDAEEVERIEAQLVEIEENIKATDFRAANTRAGYVYVISNVGAFGPGIVKIGLTRRLEPMDRVNELGGASVPFRFDVHALFFADDAVAIETMLHRHFAPQRVNKVNLRREYFYTTPQKVQEFLKKDAKVAAIEFKAEAEADEYRRSLAMNRGSSQV